VKLLAQAFADHCSTNSSVGLETYSTRALTRVWQAARFSCWLTDLLHHVPDRSGFDRKLWRAELDRLRFSQSAQKSFAENYVGL
jgi:p-hydroxybenzoate 3-monooxygenase